MQVIPDLVIIYTQEFESAKAVRSSEGREKKHTLDSDEEDAADDDRLDEDDIEGSTSKKFHLPE